ncbi:MAG: Crp/Fnr family transcriptional regulator [Clostridiaceae bacterium]|nr:Crp/Fnr family transcriptional regulator [Clostridiaceae bacterium]
MSDFFKEALPFYKQLSKEQQLLIANNIYMKDFQKGTIIHAGSQDCTGLFLVETGAVRAYILYEEGKEITLYRLLPRDICMFSASCVMNNITFEIFMETITDTRVHVIPPEIFKTLKNTSLPVADYINKLLASRISDMVWVIEQVVFKSFDKRLAAFLLEMSAIEDSNTLETTHDQIAKNLGTAREVVSRMLKYFESINLVELNRGVVRIIDMDALYKLSES